MNIKTYLIHCGECGKKTLHRITKVSRKRGVKLSCISCLYEKDFYIKAQNLEEKEQ